MTALTAMSGYQVANTMQTTMHHRNVTIIRLFGHANDALSGRSTFKQLSGVIRSLERESTPDKLFPLTDITSSLFRRRKHHK
uniref:Uncharacterized protein n=1 Tax=Onchocerca volvulus TaxID=6282 RepID=A0A8R1Y8D8_ONCVO